MIFTTELLREQREGEGGREMREAVLLSAPSSFELETAF